MKITEIRGYHVGFSLAEPIGNAVTFIKQREFLMLEVVTDAGPIEFAGDRVLFDQAGVWVAIWLSELRVMSHPPNVVEGVAVKAAQRAHEAAQQGI
jgi:hypothetical protein